MSRPKKQQEAEPVNPEMLAQIQKLLEMTAPKELKQFAKDYPCHCAQNYPGSTAYHGHDCENAVVQDFVAQWQDKAGKS